MNDIKIWEEFIPYIEQLLMNYKSGKTMIYADANTYLNSKDFYLVGFLLAKNEKLIDHWRSNGITTFVFKKSIELDSLIHKYYGMEALVNPIDYGHSLRTLKSIIHSNENANEPNSKNDRDR